VRRSSLFCPLLQTFVSGRPKEPISGVMRGEMVEKELDILIERRSRKGEVDPDEQEAIWRESVRRYEARRKEANRLAWCATSSAWRPA
jgi:hypothetical protein